MRDSSLVDLVRGLCQRIELLAESTGSDRELLDRYLRQQDQAAFAALLCRHGPMVLGVCERVLQQRHDAEDAYQATFLVLARKAASLGRRASLAGWLYGVAHRTALKARTARRRRRTREQAVAVRDGAVVETPSAADWRGVLDEELSRLPETYRQAVVLFHLQGHGVATAAAQLGWKVGRFRGALFRGRHLLAKRLRRRGIDSAVLAAPAAGPPPRVPASLQAVTLRVAAEGELAVAGPVLELGRGVVMDMLVSKLKTLAALLVVAGFGAGGGAYFTRTAPAIADPVPVAPAGKQRCDVLVASARDGIVVEVAAKVGQAVKAGDLLLRIDDREALAQLETAKIKLAGVQAKQAAAEVLLVEAKERLDRSRDLYKRAAVAMDQVRLDELTAERQAKEVAAAEQAVRSAEQEIRQCELRVALHQVRSPAPGIVRSVLKLPGEGVKALEGVIELTVKD